MQPGLPIPCRSWGALAALLVACAVDSGAAAPLDQVRSELPSGLTILALRRPGMEHVFLRLWVPSLRGAVPSERAAAEGIALAALVELGNDGDRRRWLDRIERLGVRTLFSGDGAIYGTLATERLAGALDLVAEMLSTRSVSPPAFTATQQARLSRWATEPSHAASIAALHLAAVRTAGSRRLAVDDALTQGNVSLPDVDLVLDRGLRPEGAVLAIVGDLKPREAADLASRALAGWSRPAGDSAVAADTPPAGAGRLRLVSMRGEEAAATLTHVRAALRIPGNDGATIARGDLLAALLQARAAARIDASQEPDRPLITWRAQAVHEARGCTTSVELSAEVPPGTGGAMLDRFDQAVRALVEEPPSPDEIDLAAQAARLRVASPEEIAETAIALEACRAGEQPLPSSASDADPDALSGWLAPGAPAPRLDAVIVSTVPWQEETAPESSWEVERVVHADSPNAVHGEAVRALRRGATLIDTYEATDAVEAFAAAVAAAPGYALVEQRLAEAQLRAGDRDAAGQAAEEAVRLNRSLLDPHLLLAALRCDEAASALAGLQEADEAIRLTGGSAEAFHQRGRCLAKLGRAKEAIAALRHLDGVTRKQAQAMVPVLAEVRGAARYPAVTADLLAVPTRRSRMAEAWAEIGDLLNDEVHDYSSAIEAYDRALVVDPLDASVWARRGGSLINAGLHDAAEESLRKAIAISPRIPLAWRRLGDLLGDIRKDRAAAAEAFAQALALEPTDSRAWYNVGDSLAYLDRPDEALAALGTAVELDPGRWSAWFRMADVLVKKKQDHVGAIQAIQRGLEATPDHPRALGKLGASLMAVGRREEGIDALRAAAELQPDVVSAWRQLGSALHERRNTTPAAVVAYRRVMELAPEEARSWSDLGSALLDAGDRDEARRYILRAVEISPDDPAILVRLGLLHEQDEDWPTARQVYEKMLQAAPDDAWTLARLGNALWELDEDNAAIALMRRSVEIGPDYAYAWMRLGDFLHGLDDLDGALGAYGRGVAAAPEDWVNQHFLGAALLEAGRPREALEPLRKSVELWPEYREAWIDLGKALRASGEAIEGASAFRRAIEVGRTDPLTWIALAEDQALWGDPAASLESIRKAVAVAAGDPKRLNDAASEIAATQALRSPGPLQEALAMALRACEMTGRRRSDPLDTLAEVYQALGQNRKALETIEEALRLEPASEYLQSRRTRLRDGGS